MADKHTLAAAGAAVWAVVGGAIAFASLPAVNDDAFAFVGLFSVLGPALAVAASVAAARGSLRGSGTLLVVSALVTPTYFAYPLNLVALAAGVWLLVTSRTPAPGPNRTEAA